MVRLITKHIISKTGERLKILVDSRSGLPLFYPNLYSTSQIRGASKSVASIQSYLISMKVLYSWSDKYSINIEERWKKAKWLKIWEIDSLRDYCSLSLRNPSKKLKKIINIKKTSLNTANVNSQTKYIRMTFIADYLKWLAKILIKTPSKNTNVDIDIMYKKIKSHRPRMKGRVVTTREDKGIDSNLLKEVIEILEPGHNNNPYQEYSLQVRNAAIITLLHCLGIRRGELLNLRVDDIDFITNTIKVVRRADNINDNRTYQPLVKTQERILPISNRLAEILTEYVIKFRSSYPRARKHPYLFVTHKKGKHQGYPLSNSGFGKLILTLQNSTKSIYPLHAHAFRHNWNYNFSKALDQAINKHSPEKEEQMRSYLMGWKETSGTASIYNKRHIKEKAKKAILNFQINLMKSRDNSDGNR